MWRVLTVTLLLATATAAQAADPAPLRAELGRLTAELAAVRGTELAQLQQQPAPRAAAVLEARLQQLEEALRRLTGQVEEVEYAQRQMAARMDRLVADMDARLRAGEGGAAAQAPAVQAPAPAPAPVTAPREQVTAAARPAAPTVEPDAAAKKGFVLGTIPEDVLRGQPTPRQPDLPAPSPEGSTQARLQPEGADSSYQGALDLLQAGRWADAEQAFTGFVQKYPDDARAPTASYWLGETFLLRKDYPTAAAVFARNYRTYGESAPRAPENLLKLGVALAGMGQRDKACQSFSELAKRHPNAPPPVRQALSRERAAAGCS